MGERIRALDWASTPLGPAASWPQSLRSAISILLPSKAQICMFWGPDLVKLYNDPELSPKRPAGLGAGVVQNILVDLLHRMAVAGDPSDFDALVAEAREIHEWEWALIEAPLHARIAEAREKQETAGE